MSTFYDPGPLPGWPAGRPRPRPDGLPAAPAPEPQAEMEAPVRAASAGPAEDHTAERQPTERHPAERRVRALRDLVRETAHRLQTETSIQLDLLYEELYSACAAIQGDELGEEGVRIGMQFEALFERWRGLTIGIGDGVADELAGPLPTDSMGLPTDARFLHDMAEYLTNYFALDTETSVRSKTSVA